ncbi:MAG: acyl-CoA thioesterase [Brevinema sp.]
MIHDFFVTARYAETDMMGVIHHSVYAVWAEVARTDLLNTLGHSYKSVEEAGVMMPVTELFFRYKRPTFYEDIICIKCAVTEMTQRTMRFDYKIMRDDTICTIGYSKHIFMDSNSRSAIKLETNIVNQFINLVEPNHKISY